jgi:hypothetical protein
LGTNLLPIIGTIDMLSTPPAMITSPMPAMICWAAMAIDLQAARAETVDRLAGGFMGRPARSADDARQVHALLGFGEGAAQHHVFDFLGINAGARDHGLDDFRRHVIGTHGAQRALGGLAHGSAGGRYNNSIAHGCCFSLNVYLSTRSTRGVRATQKSEHGHAGVAADPHVGVRATHQIA